MAIDSTTINLFQEGKEFNQIYFLDNFYQNINIEEESDTYLAKLLTTAINNASNSFVRRTAFKILCDLTLVKKIKNRFCTLSHLQDFLSTSDSSLQAIALKYLPHFPEASFSINKEQLKELTDHDNADVASQAFLCLGILQLVSGISGTDSATLIIHLNKAKPNFQAADEAVENRVDAKFYQLFIDWLISILSQDIPMIIADFERLKKNLQVRSLYEFEEMNLELDFLIFQFINKFKSSFEITSTSQEWLEIQPQIQTLLNIHLEVEKIRKIHSTNIVLANMLFETIFKNIEVHNYKVHLSSQKQRLNALNAKTSNSQLRQFIEFLISEFPNSSENGSENLKLLALLSEHLGEKKGLEIYKQVMKKEVTLEKAIEELLRKGSNNQLPYRTGSIQGQETLISLMSQIDSVLPDYPSDKREVFFNIIEEVIRYVRTTLVGNEKKRFPFLYSKSEKIASKNGLGQDALEEDLQKSMLTYFEHSKIADGLDHEKSKFVDGGRVDIVYKKDLITIPIELKKSLNRPNKDTLEKNYISQAQTYTAGYDQLGIFVLLELSNKSTKPQPNFKDWFKVHHLPPSTNQNIQYPDYIISVIIPGNKTTPSAKSIYK
ncbi:hypothetical protein DMA11_21865 [Marinilabiliaceae bacterium JC017]|nr:hypothetical protein DMA11_21865 [Marinilabiliaceae bacterium JC017]